MDSFFEKFGYKIVRNAYDPANHRAGLKDLFEYTKNLHGGSPDSTSPTSPAFSGDLEMSKVLMRLLPTIEAETGLQLFPTYVYFRRYGSDAVLPRHTDRPACEISCTMCVGFEGDFSWPIWVEDREGRAHEVSQNPGDVLIYQGIDRPHWREPADARVFCQSQVFLHYVDQDGPHQDEIFDLPQLNKAMSAMATAAVKKKKTEK